jgi:hypothetical protein
MPCTHCHRPLNEGIYNATRTLKSCPNCSVNNGSEHVYYDRPAEFGTTHLRVTAANPDGDQSHCQACRGGQTPTARAVLCHAV